MNCRLSFIAPRSRRPARCSRGKVLPPRRVAAAPRQRRSSGGAAPSALRRSARTRPSRQTQSTARSPAPRQEASRQFPAADQVRAAPGREVAAARRGPSERRCSPLPFLLLLRPLRSSSPPASGAGVWRLLPRPAAGVLLLPPPKHRGPPPRTRSAPKGTPARQHPAPPPPERRAPPPRGWAVPGAGHGSGTAPTPRPADRLGRNGPRRPGAQGASGGLGGGAAVPPPRGHRSHAVRAPPAEGSGAEDRSRGPSPGRRLERTGEESFSTEAVVDGSPVLGRDLLERGLRAVLTLFLPYSVTQTNGIASSSRLSRFFSTFEQASADAPRGSAVGAPALRVPVLHRGHV